MSQPENDIHTFRRQVTVGPLWGYHFINQWLSNTTRPKDHRVLNKINLAFLSTGPENVISQC